MLKTILFYSFSVIAIFWESFVLFHPQTVSSFIKFMPKKVEDFTKTQMTYGIMTELYFIWGVIGLFTSQKILFLSLLILCISNIKKSLFGLVVDAFISIFILLIIILNRFDWNIDMWLYIRQYFNN